MACLGDGITDPAHVLDQFRAELLAQPVHVHLDGIAVDIVLPALELGLELGARQHHARAREQGFEHGPFAGRKSHMAPVDRCLA